VSSRNRTHPRLSLPAIIGGVSLFFAAQYGIALWNLNHSTGEMRNKFSDLAREEYLGFLIRQNLAMLPAYVLLCAAATFLCRPIIAALPYRNKYSHAGLAFAITAGLHYVFTVRLVMSRPYFVNVDEVGHWYFIWISWIPDAVKPTFFFLLCTLLPLALATWALARDFKQSRRTGRILITSLVIAALTVFVWKPWHHTSFQPHSAQTNSPNILIIGSDSLRGDRLGCSGYRPHRADGPAAQGVSPHIDALAARSTRFERCYTAIASTIESGVQLMASQYPHTHGIRQMYPDQATVDATNARVETLAALLRKRGYDTAAIGDWCAGYYEVTPLGFETISVSTFDNFKIYMSQAVIMAHFVIPLYFDNDLGYRLFPQLQSFAQFVTPEVVTARVENRLGKAARSGRPFFWHVFYSCNHLPYRSKEPYTSLFTDPAYSGKNRNGVDFDIDSFIGGTDLESKWNALPDEEIRQIRALYDGCTRQFDDCVGRILTSLRKNGLDRNTIVIITGDHGDDLYEPGVTLGHGLTFNGALHANHVPMIVHVPGTDPRVIPETVRLIDVAPTLADLAGAPHPTSWEGSSFASWLRGEGPREHRPFYGETGFPFIQFRVPGVERPQLPPMDEMTVIEKEFNYQFVLKPEYREPLVAAKQRCLRTRDWKLVCTPTVGGSRHFGLFHLATDPNGETDLATSRPEVLTPMRTALETWMDQRIETPIRDIFPNGEP
jgi:arylsulfatase A-like enzyme